MNAQVIADVPAPGPLDGLTVLEISSFVAAPLGGMTLAQLGADVIRVDPIGGAADVGRWPLAPSGTSLYWTGLNKGKRSLTLNFRDKESRGILADLVARSGPGGGIVLTNARHGWLGYDELVTVAPGVPAVLRLDANIAGRFSIEAHNFAGNASGRRASARSHEVLLYLEVYPR